MYFSGKHNRKNTQEKRLVRCGPAAAVVAAVLIFGMIQTGCEGTVQGQDASSKDASSEETSSILEESSKMPSAFDLRSVDTNGDGEGDRCYVPPVRSQKPLGDCWAFAATAASETSLLGSVLENDPEAYKTLNLSEKHLAYFASTAIDDPDHPQNGEGRYVTQINDAHDIYDEGNLHLAGSVYAMGVGPVLESDDPNYEHRGKKGVIDQKKDAAGDLYDYSYSIDDDWTLDKSSHFCQDYVLTGMYELPCPNLSPSGELDDPEYLYNEEGTAAIKDQLLKKHAVAIGFHSDLPELWESTGESEYLNTVTWAHYTWKRGAEAPPNHAVTIIGWDDNYPAANFLEGHKPPENGAWLVKNSWGSGANEFPDRATGMWGLPIDPGDPSKGGSGYFWLSYYDQSISSPTVYYFDFSLFGADDDTGFDPKTVMRNQHDLMPNNMITHVPSGDEGKMANVFMADTAQTLTSISFMTGAPDTAVTYKIYLLEPGYRSPEDGELAAEGEAVCPYSGFYMESLAKQIPVEEGQTFSIVMTYRMADGTYAYGVATGFGKEAPNVKAGIFLRYSSAVIGKGESYVCRDGSWVDMASEDGLIALLGNPDMLKNFKESDTHLDNFNIKAYGLVR